jgi:GNAT superfamily N-acetyltransferase
MKDITIASYAPGAIGRVAELHAAYYSKHWDFGLYFEAKVATELAQFLLGFDPQRDGFWTACTDNRVEGSIAIDGAKAEADGAHLRWFILSEVLRGRGFGNRLLSEALEFCQSRKYTRVFLWTFKGLDAARHLYEKCGFCLEAEAEANQWGKPVVEQRFVLSF